MPLPNHLTLTDGATRSRILLTSFTTAAIFAVYWTYAAAVVPLLQSPGLSVSGDSFLNDRLPVAPEINRQMAEIHLAQAPWTATAKHQLRTREAYIYFDEWQSVELDNEQDAVRFAPFAMIWLPKERSADERPITIVSERAYMTFDSEFDVMDLKPGRIVRGGLEGDVVIAGPDGLLVRGPSFIFEKEAMHIRCDDQVQFFYKQHRGEARGLQIELAGDPNLVEDDELGITGVKSLRLRRDVKMDLAGDEVNDAGEPMEIRIRSAGSFEYVFDTLVATFEDTVRVFHPTGPDEYDLLQCPRLSLHFEEPASQPAAGNVPQGGTLPLTTKQENRVPQSPGRNNGPSSPTVSNLDERIEPEFRRLHASGGTVHLISAANAFRASMSDLHYDRRNRVAVMKDENFVQVKSETIDLHSPEITISHNEEGSVVSIWCRGAGRLVNFDEETRRVRIFAGWEKQLRMYPDPQTGLDIIELNQRALIGQPQQDTRLAAEKIWIWIERQKKADSSAADGESRRADPRMIKHLLARDDVAMVSPEMEIQTEQLQTWFKADSPEQAAANEPVGLVSHDSTAATATPPDLKSTEPGTSLRFQENARIDPPGGSKAVTQLEGGPVEIAADRIKALVLLAADQRESRVAHVWAHGNVDVKQQRRPDEEPSHVHGNELHVWNRGEGDQLLQVFGQTDAGRQQPAKVNEGGMNLEGRSIQYDRSGNVAGVEGPGRVELPVDRTLDGQLLDKPRTVVFRFQHNMTFNGKTIELHGGVIGTMNDDNSQNTLQCRKMQVVLAEMVQFSETVERDKVEIDRIVCEGQVRFRSEVSVAGRLQEIRRGGFSRLVLFPAKETFEGFGPNGWLTFWRHGREGQRAFALVPVAKANSPLRPNEAEWEYMRVSFSGKMTGDRSRNSSVFEDNVEVLYGPVNDSSETIDRDHLPEQGGWMGCQKLEVFQRRESAAGMAVSPVPPDSDNRFIEKRRQPLARQTASQTDGEPLIELLARGNAELEGRSYFAQADEIKYDGSKGLYIIRSDVSRTATIWRQSEVGGDYSPFSARSWEFIPSRNVMKANQITGIDAVP